MFCKPKWFTGLFVPPILEIIYFRLRAAFFYPKPRRRKIVAGPLEGRYLLIEDYPSFNEMLHNTADIALFKKAAIVIPGCEKVYDIGGHMGYHSLYFAALSPSVEIEVFEPAPVNQARLKDNLEMNPDLGKRIKLNPCALGSKTGKIQMMAAPFLCDINIIKSVSDKMHTNNFGVYKDLRPISVDICRLDDINDRKRVGFIKIDVEGSEADVILGGKRFLKEHSPVLIIEIHSAALGVEVSALLLALHYIVDVIDDASKDRCVIMAHKEKS